jgi:multidrug efflux system membrane fusion protein
VALFVLFLVALAWWRHSGPAPDAAAGGGRHHGSGAAGGLVAVGAAAAVSGSMPITLDELGTVTPLNTVTVLPQISGYLTQVAFTEGQDVTQGQFLAQIDPRPYQIQLEQDQAAFAKDTANLEAARSDLARYELLAKQDSIAPQQVSDAQYTVAADAAAVQADQANIDTAKLDLTYCHIISPVAGRVGLRLVDPGNYVTPGSTTGIAVVTTMQPTTVVFSVAQTDLAPVLTRLGQGATLTASAYDSADTTRLEDGTLTAVDNQVNSSTGMVKLRATFPNADNALFPNEFVNLHLLVDTVQNATLVPVSAVQNGAPGTYVYVVQDDNTVHVQPITTGATDGTNIVVTKGVNPGDVVVTDGTDRLTEGAKVSVTMAPVAPAAAPGAAAAAPPTDPTPAAAAPGEHHHHHHHGNWQGGQGGAGGWPGGGQSGADQTQTPAPTQPPSQSGASSSGAPSP